MHAHGCQNKNSVKIIMPHCTVKYILLWVMSYEWIICVLDNWKIILGAGIWQKQKSKFLPQLSSSLAYYYMYLLKTFFLQNVILKIICKFIRNDSPPEFFPGYRGSKQHDLTACLAQLPVFCFLFTCFIQIIQGSSMCAFQVIYESACVH